MLSTADRNWPRRSSLLRNVGSAIGISVTSVLITQNTQIVHAQIAEHVTPFSRWLQTGAAYLVWNSATPPGVAALNAEVTRQASIIAFIDDFKLLMLLCLPMALLLLLMRRPEPEFLTPSLPRIRFAGRSAEPRAIL